MNKATVGIFVDAVNVTMNGGFGLRYDILRRFTCRSGYEPARLNVYLAFDKERAKDDESYKNKTDRFSEVLWDFEYKVIEKPVQYHKEPETQETIIKSTVTMDMAVDMITQAEYLDKVVLLTNNGNYVSVVNALQQRGCRVELVGFDDMPRDLKKEVDTYFSGYLIPGLLPIESPYETVYAHISEFESNFDTGYLPSRNLIFEMDLLKNGKGLFAEDIVLVSAP